MDIVTRTVKMIAETGEILSEEESTEHMYAWNKDGYLFYNGKRGARSNSRMLSDAELDVTDRGRLSILTDYIEMDGSVSGDVPEVLGLSYSRSRAWLKRMEDKGIIRKSGASFYLNPIYISRSARISIELYRLFQPEIDPFLPEWAREKYAEADAT